MNLLLLWMIRSFDGKTGSFLAQVLACCTSCITIYQQKPNALNGSSAVYREIFVLTMSVQQMTNSK